MSMKLVLNQDCRRVPVIQEITYSKLVEQIALVFRLTEAKTKKLVIKYTDDEGDLCTVTSDDELGEALHLFKTTNKIIRFALSFKKPKQPKQAPASPSPVEDSDPSHADSKQASEGPVRTCPVWPRFGSPCSGQFKGGEGCKGTFGKRLMRKQQYSELQEKALAMMDSSPLQAVDIFLQQLEVSRPWDAHFPLYNIACCYALSGQTENALNYLTKAVQRGMKNVKHMETDADLASLRDLPEFKALLVQAQTQPAHQPYDWRKHCKAAREAKAASEAPKPEVPVSEPAPPANPEPESAPAPAAAEPAPFLLDQMLQQVLSNFPVNEMRQQVMSQLPVIQQHLQAFTQHLQQHAQAQAQFSAQAQAPSSEQPAAAPVEPQDPKPADSGVDSVDPYEEVYAVPLQTLSEMGFTNRKANLEALKAAEGNLGTVISTLLS